MKKLLLPIALAGLLFTGCETISVHDSVPFIAPVTKAVTIAAINFTLDNEEDRREVADQMYAIAAGVRSLSGGEIPSPEAVNHAITSFGGSKSRYADLAQAVSGIYATYFKKLDGNAQEAFEVLEAIARGCEEAAAQILSVLPEPQEA